MTHDEYVAYLKSPEWKAKRLQAIAHYGRKCAICGFVDSTCGSSYYWRIHHKTYAHLGNEPMEDLQVLCWECHDELHGVRR